MADRTVHAHGDGINVVRYDKAGAWYIEQPSGRRRVTIKMAALFAYGLVLEGGSVYLNRAGGMRFDSEYRRLDASAPRPPSVADDETAVETVAEAIWRDIWAGTGFTDGDVPWSQVVEKEPWRATARAALAAARPLAAPTEPHQETL